ncbi:MAG: FdtA/QdtA family cupin domain-containing protein [Bacteroidales bacterium]
MRVNDVKVIDLPKFTDTRGNLSFVEQFNNIPFEIKRTYWIYDVPGGAIRGGHAYNKNKEFIVALSGSFDVIIDDGKEKKVLSLNRSYYGIYVPNGLWREMNNFSTNALCLVLSSTKFDEWDYVDNYADFLRKQCYE